MVKKSLMIIVIVAMISILSACQNIQAQAEGKWTANDESQLITGDITAAEMLLNEDGTVEVSIISKVYSFGTTKSQTETTKGQWAINDDSRFTFSFDDAIMNAVFNKSGAVWLENGKIYVEITAEGSTNSLMAFVFEKDK